MQKYKDKSLNIEERIDDLLSKMTNEEKVGQMLQVSYNTLSKEDYEKYKNLGIGSFLHVLGDEADDIKAVSYTHLRAPRDRQKSRMPSSA